MSAGSVEDYFQALSSLIPGISRQDLRRAEDILFDAWKQETTVFLMGNGGSASTATHFACDLAKSALVEGKKPLKAVSLVDNIPLVSAWTNDNGFDSIFVEQLRPWLKAGDVLIAISVHGGSGKGMAGPWSQNLGRALALARERGSRVIGLSGFDGGLLKKMADVCLVVPAEKEPLATPLVESFHSTLHHLLCYRLKQRIQESSGE